MNDKQFDELAESALKRIEDALEDCGADLDFEMVGEHILEIIFADDSKIIVNRHAAAQEIWVAAKSGGFHFRWTGKVWHDTRQGDELLTALSRLISQQARQEVTLR